jgi:hypothetical protein
MEQRSGQGPPGAIPEGAIGKQKPAVKEYEVISPEKGRIYADRLPVHVKFLKNMWLALGIHRATGVSGGGMNYDPTPVVPNWKINETESPNAGNPQAFYDEYREKTDSLPFGQYRLAITFHYRGGTKGSKVIYIPFKIMDKKMATLKPQPLAGEVASKKGAAPDGFKTPLFKGKFEIKDPPENSIKTHKNITAKIASPFPVHFEFTVRMLPKGNLISKDPVIQRYVEDTDYVKDGNLYVVTIPLDPDKLAWGASYKIDAETDAGIPKGRTSAKFSIVPREVATKLSHLKKGASPVVKPPVTSSLTLRNRKAFYVPGEEVRVAVQGETQEEPEVKCSPDGIRWSSDCPGLMMRKMGNQWVVRATAPGKYSLNLGDASEEFEVRAAAAPAAAIPGATPTSPAARIQPAPAPAPAAPTLPVPATKIPVAKTPKVVLPPPGPKTPITLSLDSKTFTAPADVKIGVSYDTRFKARYTLKQTSGGGYNENKEVSGDLKFNDLSSGGYELEVFYFPQGTPRAKVTWTVKLPVQKVPVSTQPSIPKPPRSPMRRTQ